MLSSVHLRNMDVSGFDALPFLLLIVIVLLSFYCWWKLSPYLKFVNYIWIDWTILRTVLFGKQSDLGAYIFQKFMGLCEKNASDGAIVLWFLEPTLVIFGDEAIKFFSNVPSLTDKPKYYNLFKFMGETSIFVSSGKRFKKTKGLMKPAFYPNVIKNIVPVMNHHASCLVQTLNETNGSVIGKIEQILKNNTLRTFLEASVGIKADSETNKLKISRLVDLFIKLLALASHRLVSPWMHTDFALKYSNSGKEYVKLNTDLDSIVKEVLEDVKKNLYSRKESIEDLDVELEANSGRQKSLGEVLMQQHLKDPSFDMDEVKCQIKGILTGGYDTTSITLMWCFWLLGHHQDIQQKAYEEVKSVTDGDIEYEDARDLTYLECILKETLRLYPAAPVYSRMSCKDIKFGKRIVPKGTPVIFNTYTLHRNPKLYPNPDDFIPERFEGGEASIKPWTHIPFAEGVRACIGKHFAMLEMKIVLSHVLRRFKILSLDRPEDVTCIYEIILNCAKPLRMQFIPRQ